MSFLTPPPFKAEQTGPEADARYKRLRLQVFLGIFIGYAGFYINGPEMQEANKEIPVHMFHKAELKRGDRIRVEFYSIPSDYLVFIYSVMMSSGSNPMMGAPANVNTNIQPNGRGVGWFLTTSVVKVETVFEDKYRIF